MLFNEMQRVILILLFFSSYISIHFIFFSSYFRTHLFIIHINFDSAIRIVIFNIIHNGQLCDRFIFHSTHDNCSAACVDSYIFVYMMTLNLTTQCQIDKGEKKTTTVHKKTHEEIITDRDEEQQWQQHQITITTNNNK